MGNNNSSYNGHVSSKSRHLHPDYRKYGASSSDLGDSSGNRMKKGYLPTRGYQGHHSKLPSPHKVLPSVTPSVLLKPTSNGAILHQGGTISGRKLLSELDMRKRSTASCPGNGDMMGPSSGRSTPNLSVLDYNMERNGPRRASSKGGNSSRDYDSEPDLRDMDDSPHHDHHDRHRYRRDDSSPQRSISPVPNSFTLIQESPAKKQIRSKKKSKAPPPPISPGEQLQRIGGGGSCGVGISNSGNGNMPCCSPNSPQLFSPCGESKKASSRLFKTKAESRLANSGPRSPEICSDLEMSRGNVVRASMNANIQANRFSRNDRDRSSVHSLVEAGLCTSKSSPMDDHHLSNRKHSANSSSRNNPEVTKVNALARDRASASSSGNVVRSSHGSNSSNAIAGEGNRSTTVIRTSTNNATGGGVGGATSSAGSSNIISLINQSGIAKDEQVPKKSSFVPPTAPYGQSLASKASPVNHKVNSNNNTSKGFASSSGGNHNHSNVHNGRRKSTAAPAVPITANVTENTKNNNNEKSNKSMFYFGMQNDKNATTGKSKPPNNNNNNNNNSISNSNNRQSHRQLSASSVTPILNQPSDSDNNNNDCRSRLMTTVLNDKIHDRLTSTNGNNHHYYQERISSSTSSELLQIKQDSGSFDTSERGNEELPNNRRDSSSELSSSDLDIPLQIRPTLPLKKLGLPRFSPSQAWRALDTVSGLSPEMSFSGRSYSGSEDNYGHDRIQPPRMRQLPPSRGNHHERSAGDSGISAGDGGSPANNPDLLAEPCVTPSTSNPVPPPPIVMGNSGVGGGRGYKLRDRVVPNGKQHHQLRHTSSDENKCWTPEQDLDESSESSEFEDQQISPPHHPLPSSHSRHHHTGSNVATRVLPAGLRSRNLGIVSDSDQYHLERPGNLYVRSRKAINGGGGGQKTHDDMKKSPIGNGSQPWRQDNHLRHAGGSNGNWFLSRSLNSLNLIGNGEYDNMEQQELRLVLAEQDDDNNNVGQDDNEDEMLHLPPDSGISKKMTMVMNMHGKPDVFNNDYDEVGGGVSSRLESEIGYGPSSMNFSSPLPSPSAVKINRSKMNRRSTGSGDQKHPVIATTHLISEEFEKEQRDMRDTSNNNVRYGSGGGGIRERRPFSHIMYLPAYDSRRGGASSGTRRTKSVDNLNFSEMTSFQQRKVNQYNSPVSQNHTNNNNSPKVNGSRQRQRSRSPFEYSSSSNNRTRNRMIKKEDPEEPFERSQSVPPFTAEEEEERRRRLQIEQKAVNMQRKEHFQEEHHRTEMDQKMADAAAAAAEREQKKRKFKFQSTLRVLERKKIEEQLSRDAEEKERRRLEEKEQMRRVEEEFQRKRVREKVLEIEAAAAASSKQASSGKNVSHHVENNNRYDVNFEPRNNNSTRNQFHQRSNNSGRNSNISYSASAGNNHSNHHQLLFQRQEPEGAPASATNGPGGDLRKELICASRNRNAFPGQTQSSKQSSELTQELSEFCTPTGQRQYFDYRRANEGDGTNHHHQRLGPTTRYYNSSSSSDIFPVTSRRDRKRGGGGGTGSVISSKSSVGYLRPQEHPQVVCDIPVKPLPYVVNFSRLSSSNMDLVSSDQDRPRSGLGGNASVLSDNYRKDWAHHSRGNGPARASSVISLHSAPPMSNLENFRHSSVDITGDSMLQTPPQSPRQSKYSTSPSASPVSHSRPLSSPEERFHPSERPPSRLRTSSLAQEMWNGDCVTGNKTVVLLNTPTSSSVLRSSSPLTYQGAPAPYDRKKSFRPIDFNPGLQLSPAHAFHQSAKLTLGN